MSFEDLLKRKLGPMQDLVGGRTQPQTPKYDLETLYYRRAVGLEIRVRPEETWAQFEIGRPENLVRLGAREIGVVAGLTDWLSASDIKSRFGVSVKELWNWVDRDLLFFSPTDPGVRLTGQAGCLEAAQPTDRIARRASMWPVSAVETPVQIAPMPPMPCGRDLVGAELVGVRFTSLERGFEVLGATISGTKKTGTALRRLLPLLDGRRTADEIFDALDKRDRSAGKKLLELLDSLTALEVRAAPPAPADRLHAPKAAQVTWLGHASVLIQVSGKTLLVDPAFFSISEPDSTETSKFDARSLPEIDAVLISHGDNDHLNPNSLLQLAPKTPIYIPAVGEKPHAYQVDMRGMLSVLGFDNVHEIHEWSRVHIGDITVTACPFSGESWDLDLAKLTYLIESPEASIYLSADSNSMNDTYRQIVERGGRIDLAFMGVSGCSETFVMPAGFGYGNFYENWVPRPRRNEWVQHCAGPKEAVDGLQILQPRFAFGYASGGASYIRTEYSDFGNHEQMAELLNAASLDTKPVALPLGEPVMLRSL